jgi:predicted dehydrogenase
MSTIAIIGSGQIGSRHLQALSFIDRPVSLQVVDPDAGSLKVAKERFDQCGETVNVRKVDFLDSIDLLSESLDLVIVATGAKARRAVVEELLARKKVRYLILEKFLFQKSDDLQQIRTLLASAGVKTWVNCPFRMVPFYQELRAKFINSARLDYNVSGSLIGIGCNAIHYLDMLAYFTGQTEFELDNNLLDKAIIPSKRPGFIEFTGTLHGISSKGSRFALTSFDHGTAPVVISIVSESLRCLIRENEAKCWLSAESTDWAWQEIDFAIPYQSQLTHLAAQKILDTGNCDLTTYEESSRLHGQLLKIFSEHLLENSVLEDGACPIT